MSRSIELRSCLQKIREARIQLEKLMSETTIAEVSVLFQSNPVFYEGCEKDPNERDELYGTDRYIHYMDMLSKTHQNLLQAQERMLRIGIHYVSAQKEEVNVRLQTRENIPPAVEEKQCYHSDSSISVSSD